jgi:hypothetical protein
MLIEAAYRPRYFEGVKCMHHEKDVDDKLVQSAFKATQTGGNSSTTTEHSQG